MKNISPNLSIREIWNVYRLLGNPSGKSKTLIDEVGLLLDNISSNDLLRSVLMFYPKTQIDKLLPTEVLSKLISGIKDTKLMEFSEFIEALHGSS